jgi:hypothetical protein
MIIRAHLRSLVVGLGSYRENIRAARRALLVWPVYFVILARASAAYGGRNMYPPPIGILPITGFNMIAFGLVAGALIIGGLIFLRVAYFSRSRR